MANEYLSIEKIKGVCRRLHISLYLLQVLKLAPLNRVNSQFPILATGDQPTLLASNGCDLPAMCRQSQPYLPPLIPAVNETILSSTKTKTVLVEGAALEPGLLVLLPKSASLEELFT